MDDIHTVLFRASDVNSLNSVALEVPLCLSLYYTTILEGQTTVRVRRLVLFPTMLSRPFLRGRLPRARPFVTPSVTTHFLRGFASSMPSYRELQLRPVFARE